MKMSEKQLEELRSSDFGGLTAGEVAADADYGDSVFTFFHSH